MFLCFSWSEVEEMVLCRMFNNRLVVVSSIYFCLSIRHIVFLLQIGSFGRKSNDCIRVGGGNMWPRNWERQISRPGGWLFGSTSSSFETAKAQISRVLTFMYEQQVKKQQRGDEYGSPEHQKFRMEAVLLSKSKGVQRLSEGQIRALLLQK